MDDGDVYFGRRPDSLRVPVPGKLERELHDINARAKADAARKEQIIVELLRMGCFLRDIGAAAGLTNARVHQIGKKHWPPPDLEQRRREAKDEAVRSSREMREAIEEFRKNPPDWMRRRDE